MSAEVVGAWRPVIGGGLAGSSSALAGGVVRVVVDGRSLAGHAGWGFAEAVGAVVGWVRAESRHYHRVGACVHGVLRVGLCSLCGLLHLALDSSRRLVAVILAIHWFVLLAAVAVVGAYFVVASYIGVCASYFVGPDTYRKHWRRFLLPWSSRLFSRGRMFLGHG